MTVQETRNALLGEKLVKALKARHFNACYCATCAELQAKVKELIAEGSTIAYGGSMSIRDSGVTDMLKAGNYNVLDRDAAQTPEEKRAIALKAFDADWFLASANAMSEDGQIVNIDGMGNRVAAITFGPRNVLYVVGLNKVCQDLDAAIKRARSTAAPTNMMRFDLNSPCHADGVCHDCKSPDSICTFISIQRISRPAGRHTVILVGEDLGY